MEHWWNGRRDVIERRDVFLRHNPAGLWEVERYELGRSRYAEFGREERARTVVRQLVARGHWRQVDAPVR